MAETELAAFWLERLAEAERPAIYSSRDGLHLKQIPPTERLDQQRLGTLLRNELGKHSALRQCAKHGLNFSTGTSEYRALLALLRARVYLRADRPKQAIKDATFAVAYAKPRTEIKLLALTTQAKALEVEGDDIQTALRLASAVEQTVEPSDDLEDWLDRVLGRLPETARVAYRHGQGPALHEWVNFQKEQEKPLILQKLPKYYWYYEWMTERIQKSCGELPEPVLDKLLTLDASDLDTLLLSKQAIQAQASEFLWVFDHKGPEKLETYKTPELTWNEVKLLKTEPQSLPPLPMSTLISEEAILTDLSG